MFRAGIAGKILRLCELFRAGIAGKILRLCELFRARISRRKDTETEPTDRQRQRKLPATKNELCLEIRPSGANNLGKFKQLSSLLYVYFIFINKSLVEV